MSLVVKRLLSGGVILVGALLVAVAVGGSKDRHELVIASDQARFMVPGLEVRVAGQVVGEVESAEPTKSGTAVLKIGVDDEAWPLRAGTRAVYRWAGTISFTNRYVELIPSTRGANLPEGAQIKGDDVTETVEVDDVARLFDVGTRAALRRTILRSGAALQQAAPRLPAALEKAPNAVDQAHAIVQDLGSDPDALATLLRSTDSIVHEIRVASPDVGQLVDGMSGTFTAVAGRAQQLRRTLEQAPATLDDTRTTLTRADSTLNGADRMLVRLAPGVQRLRRTAAPLSALLERLLTVAPDARTALATLRLASPDLNGLLSRAATVAPKLEKTAGLAKPQLECIRPYAPEVAGFAGTWNGFIARGDGSDKYARANAVFYPYQEGMGLTSADVQKVLPQLHYAFPRPPGEIANQPWFLPKCGLGPDTVDPSKDPEIKR